MSQYDNDMAGGVATEKKTKTKKPRPWNVVIWNDDYTTMEFVVRVLEKVFHHGPAAATQIMLKIHNKGKGVAGTFSRDIAESKCAHVINMAKEAGHPLKCTTERA